MDADYLEKRREWSIHSTKIAERQDRFSMDPQRFEEILAEITTGYGNIRSSFDNVNIAEILEEMVTEFARAALEAAEAPKFTELAVLLQHCATLYGRKVDYLYQHVVEVCDALQGEAREEGVEAAGGARRRRRASAAAASAAGFTHVSLEACSGAARARAPRPPPTLPRMYIELEPRAPAPHEEPLRDEAGEAVGAPADFHVAWRLRAGLLVDELEGARGAEPAALRPLSLLELQEALAAAAPPDPPPLSPDLLSPAPERAPSPPCSLPPPLCPTPPPPSFTPPPPPPAALARRKRRSSAKLADIVDSPIKIFKAPEAAEGGEFLLPQGWVARVVCARARALLAAREATTQLCRTRFRGFEEAHPEPGGFPGWSAAEAAAAEAAWRGVTLRHSELESDDDGFFENSSFSSLESSRSTPPPPPAPPAGEAARAADAAWSAGVAARAAAAEARGGVEVRALARDVLGALPPDGAARRFAAVLRRAAQHPCDVSRLLLATLFLANSGNVCIEGGAPPAVGHFSVSLVDADERRYAAAADAEAQLHAAPPQPHAAPPQPHAAPPQPHAAPPQPHAAPPQPHAAPPQPHAAPPQPHAAPPQPHAAPPQPA